jgi:hypothetical protein
MFGAVVEFAAYGSRLPYTLSLEAIRLAHRATCLSPFPSRCRSSSESLLVDRDRPKEAEIVPSGVIDRSPSYFKLVETTSE